MSPPDKATNSHDIISLGVMFLLAETGPENYLEASISPLIFAIVQERYKLLQRHCPSAQAELRRK